MADQHEKDRERFKQRAYEANTNWDLAEIVFQRCPWAQDLEAMLLRAQKATAAQHPEWTDRVQQILHDLHLTFVSAYFQDATCLQLVHNMFGVPEVFVAEQLTKPGSQPLLPKKRLHRSIFSHTLFPTDIDGVFIAVKTFKTTPNPEVSVTTVIPDAFK